MSVGFGQVLVTGGAGFIGSHIVDSLLEEGVKVRVVDDLSTGDKTNLSEHENSPDFELIQGDIRDFDVVKKAVEGFDAVVHEAGLVSVTQSVENPLLSNSINVVGTLTPASRINSNDISINSTSIITGKGTVSRD